MTLVERLRAHLKDYAAALEAADEIERLRRDLSHARACTEVWMNRARKAEGISPSQPVDVVGTAHE